MQVQSIWRERTVVTAVVLAALNGPGWAAAPGTPAAAATAGAAPPVQEMAEVLVTASRVERPAVTTPASVSVITAADIAGSTAQSVPDVLRFFSGVSVSDYMGNGRTAQVDIRGFGESAPSNTLVLVDGRRMNAPDMSGVDWTTIPLERIDRIEIVRGGGSVLYGDNAVGGIINIRTKQGAPRNTLTSETLVGSYETFKQALGLAGSQGPLWYAMNSSYHETQGYRDNGYLRNKSAGLNLSYLGTSWFDCDFSAGAKEDRYGMPGYVTPSQDPTSSAFPNDYAETKSAYVQAVPKFKLNGNGEFSLGLSYAEKDAFSRWVSWGTQSAFDIKQYSISPKYTVTSDVGGMENQLSAGADVILADLRAIDFYTGDMSRLEQGYYLNDTFALVKDTLLLDLGYRRSRIDYDFARSADAGFDIDAYRAALTYAYREKSKVFVAFDRGFRTQLLEEFGGPYGNLLMVPQISYQYQAGVRHYVGRFLTGGVTAFQIDTHDEIFYDPSTYQNTNYPQTRRRGVEVNAESRPFDSLRLFANYTWLDAELLDGPYDGQRLPGVGQHMASAGVTYSPVEQIALDVRSRWAADRLLISDWRNVAPEWSGDDYLVVDARLSYSPTKWLEIYVGVNNVFAQEYAEYGVYSPAQGPVAYPSPARNFVAGVNIRKEF